jgi:Na+-transporting NADH:ubiquinone oxidoreductase subunit C
MALDKNSNAFTFGFATAMVVVVGALLAFTYLQLKPMQQDNVRREKMQNILSAMNVHVSRDEAPAMYARMIANTVVVDISGRPKEGDAFEVDVQKDYRDVKAGVKREEDLAYPVYIADKDGRTIYILPMVGTGLWGPIWGYVAVADDGRTVVGSTFDHKGETPGLGAEIATPVFTNQFPGKKIADDQGRFTSIKVYKGGSQTTDPHGVDGISGGTITSDGVDEMLRRTLAIYAQYLATVTSTAHTSTEAATEPLAENLETIETTEDQ